MGKEKETFSLDDIDELIEFDDLDEIDDLDDLEDIDNIDDIDEVPSSKKKELEEYENNSVLDTTNDMKKDTKEILAKEEIIISKEKSEDDEEDDENSEGSGKGKIWIIAAIFIVLIVIILLLLSSCNKKYTVTFESNGGTNVMEQEIEENGLAIEPDKPIRTGYIFLGWYHGDKKFDFNTEITSDITLEAKWINGNNAEVRSVKLDQNIVTIAPDNTILLVATIEPEDALDQTVEWESSDENIVTVDSNGNVTGVSEGTAKIIVTTTSGGYTDICNVTVSQDIVSVKSLKLDETVLNMETKDKKTLKATIEPVDATNKGIVWTSSNKSVAKVNSAGTVEAVGAGSATITATTKDGNFSQTVQVNVKDVAVKNIALNVDTLTMEEKQTVDLKVIFDPANTTKTSVIWESSDPKIVRVDTNGKITAVKPGKAIITVTTTEGNKKATCAVTVSGLESIEILVKDLKDKYYVGDIIELTASKHPSNVPSSKLSWKSSNDSVATVNNNGVVTIKAAGEFAITVTAENGVSSTKQFVATEKVTATSIKINEGNVSLFVNDFKQLSITATPTDAQTTNLLWESSVPNVVAVNSTTGKIQGLAEGNATIKVSLKDNPSISASINVEVKKSTVTFEKIDSNGSTSALNSNATYKLEPNESIKVKVNLDNPNAKFTYATSGDTISVTGAEASSFRSGHVFVITNNGLSNSDIVDFSIKTSDNTNALIRFSGN